MASVPSKNAKAIIQDEKDVKETVDSPSSFVASNSLNAPKHGTVIPNRVFVGGICSATTEAELMGLFSNYGIVTGVKIIADRAGVSKGYGFVTFESEEEAKQLQKDANNIILRERRLNIAPAIKKQGYGRPQNYDCNPATPVPMPGHLFRQNGVAFTYHNGMAFFPQPSPQSLNPQHMEPQAVYQQGSPYGTVPQGSPAPAYQYPYSQGQVLYQAPPQYPYHIPQQFEGGYDQQQLMMPDGNLVVSQFYVAAPPQPGHEYSYYPPAQIHPQESSPALQHQIMYPSPRAFETGILYSEMGPVTRGGMRGGSHHQYQQHYPQQLPHHRPEGGKWSKEDDGGCHPLTPPITPKSEAGRANTPVTPQQEDLVKSMQAVAI